MTLRTGLAVALTAGLVLIGIAPAGAQGTYGLTFQNWNFLGGGARARGMGGAYIGLSDDVYAGTWNPAGLVYNEGVSLGINYSFQHVGLDLDYNAAGRAGISKDGDANLSNVTSASFVSPLAVLEKEFLVSVFYNRVQDIFTESYFAADVDPVEGAPFSATYGKSGNIAAAGAAFGTTLHRRLTIGASLSLMTGDGHESVRTDIDSTRDTASYNESVSWMSSSDLDYSGLSVAISALYRAESWNAGFVITPPYGLTESVDYFARRLSYHNRIPSYSDAVYAPLHGTDREISMPLTVALGGSYRLGDNLIFAADYTYRGFNADDKLANDGTSNYRMQQSPSEPNSDFEELTVEWYNLHQFRLGMEYKRETAWGAVPIRVGLRNDPMLLGDPSSVDVVFDQRLDSTKTVEFPYYSLVNNPGGTGDQVNAWTFTVGSGLHWSQIRLDAALEVTAFSYEETGSLYSVQRCTDCLATDPSVTIDTWGKRQTHYWGDYARVYDNSRVRFLMNLTGYF